MLVAGGSNLDPAAYGLTPDATRGANAALRPQSLLHAPEA